MTWAVVYTCKTTTTMKYRTFPPLTKHFPALLQSNFHPCHQATTALGSINELIFPQVDIQVFQHYFFKGISH